MAISEQNHDSNVYELSAGDQAAFWRAKADECDRRAEELRREAAAYRVTAQSIDAGSGTTFSGRRQQTDQHP